MNKASLIILVLLCLLSTSCTLDRVSGSSSEALTEANLEAATLILGESISGNNSGIYLSVQDLLAIISQSGFTPKTLLSAKSASYDQINNFRSFYNQDTGEQVVTFERTNESRTKVEQDSLLYIYRDENGEVVAFPREQQNLIETINYSGIKEGVIRSGEIQSTFLRNNDFFISGIGESSPTLPLQGKHVGSGSVAETSMDGNSTQRYYELSFLFLNVEIERTLNDQNQTTDFELSGGLIWEMNIWDSPEKINQPLSISGTMSFVGDGTVVIRINGEQDAFLLDVQTGEEINTN